MPQNFDFYVVQQDNTNPELYLVGYDKDTHQVTFGPNIDYAFWSTKQNKVTAFINEEGIQGATAQGKNGVHPSQRPPF
jgi:hypothetical protein